MDVEFSIEDLVNHIQLKLEDNEITISADILEMILGIEDDYMLEKFFINKGTE